MRPILVAALLVGACLPVFSSCAVTPSHASDSDQECFTSSSTDNTRHQEGAIVAFLKQRIGHGVFGTVFRAELLGEPVALKVIHKMKVIGDKFTPWTQSQLESIATEVSILHTLFSHETGQNPALLLDSYGVFEDDNNLYMAMELGFCDLYTLRAKYYPLPVSVVQSIMVDVVKCVAALHEVNVMVRDIKCENIVISQDGRAMLVDFNLAKNDGTLEDNEAKGSADYLAFEMTDPDRFPTYTHKVDSWSIGCVMFVLATNMLPFDTGRLNSPVKLSDLKQILESGMIDIGAVTQFDPRMTTVVRACLRKDPAVRPSAQELLEYPYFRDAKKHSLRAARRSLIKALKQQPVDDDNDDLASATSFTRQRVEEAYRQQFQEAMPESVPIVPIQVVIDGCE